jgi:hypothetical protein
VCLSVLVTSVTKEGSENHSTVWVTQKIHGKGRLILFLGDVMARCDGKKNA